MLVHGAWADSSSWNKVIAQLQAKGYTVKAPANPLRGLTGDADYIRDYLSVIQGPIVLVGHSYGGAVITNAAKGNPNVQALVYIDAFAPAEGEPIVALTGADSALNAPPETVFDFAPYPGAPAGDVDLYLKQDVFLNSFMQDVPKKQALVYYAGQKPAAASGLGAVSGPPAWEDIPSWYLIGKQDKVITPDAQKFMAKRAGSEILYVNSSARAAGLTPGCGDQDDRPAPSGRADRLESVAPGDRVILRGDGNVLRPAALFPVVAQVAELRRDRCRTRRSSSAPALEIGDQMPKSCTHLDEIDAAAAALVARLRGLPRDGWPLAAPADVPRVRPRRLLRLVAQQARDRPLQEHRPPARLVVRAGRELALVLRRRGRLRSLRPPGLLTRMTETPIWQPAARSIDKPVILTVDDDPSVSRAVARDLRRQYGPSHRIVRASSGAEALEALRDLKLRGGRVAVLLADHRMPEMSGIEFLEQAMDIFPRARRALLTAYADTEAAISAINLVDVDHYLLKPWDPPEEKLFPIVDSMIDAVRQRAGRADARDQGRSGTAGRRTSFKIRDFLARNAVPYRWFGADEPEGQRLLDAAELGRGQAAGRHHAGRRCAGRADAGRDRRQRSA